MLIKTVLSSSVLSKQSICVVPVSVATAHVHISVQRSSVLTCAKRRVADSEGFFFEDVFQSSGERVYEAKGFLRVGHPNNNDFADSNIFRRNGRNA